MWVQFQLGLHLLKVNCVICCFLKIKSFHFAKFLFIPLILYGHSNSWRTSAKHLVLSLLSDGFIFAFLQVKYLQKTCSGVELLFYDCIVFESHRGNVVRSTFWLFKCLMTNGGWDFYKVFLCVIYVLFIREGDKNVHMSHFEHDPFCHLSPWDTLSKANIPWTMSLNVKCVWHLMEILFMNISLGTLNLAVFHSALKGNTTEFQM